MNMTASPPATARGKLNCDPQQKTIAHLGEDAKTAQKRDLQTPSALTNRSASAGSILAVAVIAMPSVS
jgi:hypothetical protein